jgi:DNA polymerase-3 subunit beta
VKITCTRTALSDALAVLSSVLSKRTPKPILRCVRIVADKDHLSLATTNLEVFVSLSLTQVDVKSPGTLVVDCDNLSMIARNCAGDTIDISLNKDQAVIASAGDSFRLNVAPPAEFPPVPTFEGQPTLTVKAKSLAWLINHVLFATAKESTRYAFNGVLLEVNHAAKMLSTCATDGRRLALASALLEKADAKSEEKIDSPIVGVTFLKVLCRLLDEDPDADVKLQQKGGALLCDVDGSFIYGNLVEGSFPPYNEVIPKDPTTTITVGRDSLLSAVQRSSLLCEEECMGIRLSIKPKKGITFSHRNPTAGESTVNLPCKVDGPEMEIGFNPWYILEAVKVITDDEITIELSAPNRPGLIRSKDFRTVVMPCNLA